MSTQSQPGGGFSLFPSTTTGTSPRRQTPRPSTSSSSPTDNLYGPVVIPGPYTTVGQPLPPAQGRQTPQSRVASPVQQPRQSHEQQHHRTWGPARAEISAPPTVQQPRQAADVPARSETAFSQAQTLIRSGSNLSRSSIAKKPFEDETGHPVDDPAAIPRSMFPVYNPEVPLNQQDYFPARSPTHIPMAVISRPMYSPEPVTPLSPPPPIDAVSRAQPAVNAPAPWPPTGGPGTQVSGPPPPLPSPSSTEDLKALWKVANGWKASRSEGQVFCLRMTQERDAPVYTLSSSDQAFYNLRVDPTSASAYVTLSRHDPSKLCRGPPPSSSAPTTPASIRSSGRGASAPAKSAWQEVLLTTLEEEPRRHRPHDGLVADLSPAAALRMAAEKPGDEAAVMLAERECARLVWDDDSASHYLAHPSLATPFCVTVERLHAWGRVEYTLEHHESPNHLARLTRDAATGEGFLEVDTALAGKIESFFIVDVAVAALLIVASADKSFVVVESFDPPPVPPEAAHVAGAASSGHHSDHFSLRSHGGGGGGGDGPARKTGLMGWGKSKSKKSNMESMEIQDVESQEAYGTGAKRGRKAKKIKGDRIRDGLPWPVRVAVTPVIWAGKCVIWGITAVLKVLVWVLKGVAKALGLIGTTK